MKIPKRRRKVFTSKPGAGVPRHHGRRYGPGTVLQGSRKASLCVLLVYRGYTFCTPRIQGSLFRKTTLMPKQLTFEAFATSGPRGSRFSSFWAWAETFSQLGTLFFLPPQRSLARKCLTLWRSAWIVRNPICCRFQGQILCGEPGLEPRIQAPVPNKGKPPKFYAQDQLRKP